MQAKEYQPETEQIKTQIQSSLYLSNLVNRREMLLDLPISDNSLLVEIHENSKIFIQLWEIALNFQEEK